MFSLPDSLLPAHLSKFLKENKNQMTKLCDAVLICEGQRFPVHRVVLAASSKYFKCLFSYSEEQKEEFNLEGISRIGLSEVLTHLGGNEMVLNMRNVCEVLHAADFLIVPSASHLCSTFLVEHLKPSNVLGVESTAKRFGLKKVADDSFEFALDHLEAVAACEEFADISVERLTKLLGDDRINVKEEVVWRIAFAWLEVDQSSRRIHLDQVLGCVRFGLMEFESFQQCVARYEVGDAQVVKEANMFLNAMKSMSEEKANQVRTTYAETPLFARPRCPSHFVITIGGYSSAPVSGIEVFDQTANRWSPLPISLPKGIAKSTAQAIGSKVYILGGYEEVGENGEWRMVRDTFILDINQPLLKSAVLMTEPRAFATSATVGSTIYVFGGKRSYLSQVWLKSCEKLDTLKSPMNWERIAPMGTGRGDAGAAVVDGKVLVVGGFSGHNFLSSVEVYNPSTNTWQMGPSLKAPRSGMGVAVLEGTVYVAGGNRGTGRLRSVERLAPGAKRWVKVASLPTKRSNFSLVSLGDKLLAAGGFDGSGVTDVVEVYHPELNKWQVVSSLPSPKSALSAVVVARRKLDKEAEERCRYKNRNHLMDEQIVELMAMSKISNDDASETH